MDFAAQSKKGAGIARLLRPSFLYPFARAFYLRVLNAARLPLSTLPKKMLCRISKNLVDEKGFEPSASSLRTRKNLK